jgi:hypothetical protein
MHSNCLVKYRLPLLCATLVLSGPIGAARADREVPAEEAIQTMQTLTGRIASARWGVRTEHGTLSLDNKFVSTPVATTGTVVFEPGSGRFRAHLNTVMPWSGGSQPFIARRSLCAFDGARLRMLRREQAGKEMPPAQPVPGTRDGFPGEASVHGDTAEFFRLWHWQSGVGYFPPYVAGVSLPEEIRRQRAVGRAVRITEDDRGMWHAELPNWESATDDGQTIVVDYDRNRGVITRAVWRPRTNPTVWKQIDYEFQKVGADWWVPKTVQSVHLLSKPRGNDRLHYSEVKVNEPVDDRVYRLEFPAGSHVVDHVEKKAYTVGQTAQDEQAMIKSYVRMHGLTVPSPPLWKRALWWGVPVVIALLGCVTVLRWRLRSAAAMLVIFAAGVSSAPAAEPTGTRSGNKDADPKVHLTQCGFQVTIFTLAAFGVETDANEVARDLMPAGFDGISLKNIQETLQTRHLKVEARHNLTVADFKQALRAGWIAIVPVEGKPSCHDYDFSGKPTVWNHYVVALHHPDKGPLLVDVLRSIVPLDRSQLKDQHLQDPKRAVLFVRR